MPLAVKLYHETLEQLYGFDFSRLAEDLRQLGVEEVLTPVLDDAGIKFNSELYQFCDQNPYLPELMAALKKEGIRTNLMFMCFHDDFIFRKFPHYRPRARSTFPYRKRSWYRPLCPSNSQLRQERWQLIEETVKQLKPDVLTLDFARFPLFWEEIAFLGSREKITEYCFCPSCLRAFQQYSEVPLSSMEPSQAVETILDHYADQWRQWKVECINNFVSQSREVTKQCSPETKFMVNYIPLELLQLDSARLLGQYMPDLIKLCDYFSPLVYHQVLLLESQEITKYLRQVPPEWHDRMALGIQIIDLFESGPISMWELEQLLGGIAGTVSRIVLFHFGVLVYQDEHGKLQYTPQYKLLQSYAC